MMTITVEKWRYSCSWSYFAVWDGFIVSDFWEIIDWLKILTCQKLKWPSKCERCYDPFSVAADRWIYIVTTTNLSLQWYPAPGFHKCRRALRSRLVSLLWRLHRQSCTVLHSGSPYGTWPRKGSAGLQGMIVPFFCLPSKHSQKLKRGKQMDSRRKFVMRNCKRTWTWYKTCWKTIRSYFFPQIRMQKH